MFTFDRSDRLDASMRRWWWLYIITGVIWALWGLMVLGLRPSSVASVALLIGITFIFWRYGQLLLAQRVHEWKWLFYVSGGARHHRRHHGVRLAGQDPAGRRPLRRVVPRDQRHLHCRRCLRRTEVRRWWSASSLAPEFLLGAWAIGSPGRELLLLINLVGFYMLFYGISEIFAGFALRSGRGETAEATT